MEILAKIGTLVDGKYEILREIGRGGMSVVYLAMDIRLNKQWAIKEIARKANDANNDIVVSSLLAEANLMKKLDHPALPRIVDIIEEQNTIYVVMDYIEGEPLSKVLEVYGAQDQDTVIEWGKQLCDVLYYLHNCEPPIIYRDMKPANVMLRPDGSVKLIDFGIAREYKRSKTADTESLGTRGYAAPEQFGGKGQTDARTDIYSFGVTLYHLVTGKNPCEPPYELYPIKQINPDFYDGLQYLIQKCTQMNPEDRFQSCDEIRYVLDNIHEFDKGRRLSQNKKYRAFIVMTILTVVFAVLGAGSLGLRYSALSQDFQEKLTLIERADDISIADSNYSASKDMSGLDQSQKLRLIASYYETLDRLTSDDASSLYSRSFESPVNYLAVDNDSKKSEGGKASVQEYNYSSLSSTDKAYFAKACYHLGRIYFKQNSSEKLSSFTEAKKYFSYIVDDSKLNLLADGAVYDTSIFTKDDLDKAESLYYLSSAYSYYLTSTDNSSSVALDDDSGDTAQMSATDAFNILVDSVDILEKDVGVSIKTSMYRAYYNALSNNLSSFKSAQIKSNDIDVLYNAIYGAGYDSVCTQVRQKFGSLNITQAQADEINNNVTVSEGIYSDELAVNNNTVKSIRDNRVALALKIYNAYNNS